VAVTSVAPLPEGVARPYLELLGLDLEPGGVDHAALRRLQRTHLERVPYENIDIVSGRPPAIDPLAAARRILGGRGGYCYHLNGALSALLAWLRVDVTRHLAGVYGGRVQEPPGPDGNHLGVTVRVGGDATWLVDVGLGDGPAEPLSLVAGEHVQGDAVYRLGPSPFGDGAWRFEHEPRGGFGGFDVASKAAAIDDFEAMHAFLSTRSSFATTVTVQRRVGERIDVLRGCVYSERSGQGARNREISASGGVVGARARPFRRRLRRSRAGRARRSLASRPGPARGVEGNGRIGAPAVSRGQAATIAPMAVTDDKPVAEQLSELGAQLAWVRDYL
jgi:N-hydroxyarylamine O-acetyltransferase